MTTPWKRERVDEVMDSLGRWIGAYRLQLLATLRHWRAAPRAGLRAPVLRWAPPHSLLAWWHSRFRPVPLFVAVACYVVSRTGTKVDYAAASPEAAMAEALAARGLACDPDDVSWVPAAANARPASTLLSREGRALVRAHVGEDPSDLYLVEARLSPEGSVLEVGDAWNITATTGADESRPAVRGHLAAYLTSADGLYTGLHVLDLWGRPGSNLTDFSWLQRAQVALTNLQHTGQTGGVVRDTFALDPVARRAAFAWRDDALVELHADDRAIVLDPGQARIISGEAFVRVLREERSRPGSLVPWAVDRVRAMPSFGDDRMQWLKAVVFTALDRWHAEFANGSSAQDVRDELGLTQPTGFVPTFTDPEIGWPPPPMKTAVSPVLPGEGQWIALDHDPFITPTPSGTAPAFVTSFVRPNVHRQDVRVYVTLWDPRQISLHIEAGTVEPIGASGEHGPGLVPRAPEVMKRFVAAFNGGFQAQHGEYGMQADGVEYLPPKPYAATVVELRDGSIAFGAWPAPAAGEAGAAAVPDDIVAFRQNLTALVQNGKFNPWGRTWWGGTPPGWPDNIHSTRSAICLTAEGFVGYFYSPSISADDLAEGMLDARCAFGIHLDMNPGHAGFEFYNVSSEGHLDPLGRSLRSDWEAEGKVAEMAGYVFRSRRMIRAMGHMLFPRYIQREARDFFYLTARPLLPGAPIAPIPPKRSPDVPGAAGSSEAKDRAPPRESERTPPDEGVWRTKGLPQQGFPYAVATTWVKSDAHGGVKLRVLRADPRMLKPADRETWQAPTVLALTAGARGPLALWWQGASFSITAKAPAADAAPLATGFSLSATPAAAARAAAGIQDEDGMLAWVELPADAPADAETAAAMDALLDRMGCSVRMALAGNVRALVGGSLDLSGAPSPASSFPVVSRLVRAHAADAHAIFTTTPIVSAQIWQPLQAKRVRYLPPKPTATPSAAASNPHP